jgi:hypothetical protein
MKENNAMNRSSRAGIITLLFVLALTGLCVTITTGEELSPAQEAEASLIKDGPGMIGQGHYRQVLDAIRELPPKQQRHIQIEVLEYFANLKGWVSARDKNNRARWWALRQQLINYRDTSATPLITVFLRDTEDWLRLYAAELLGYIGDKGALEELSRVGRDDPNAKVKKYAVWAYKQITMETARAAPPTRSSRKTKTNTFTVENPYTKDPTVLVAISAIAAAKRGTLESYPFARTASDAPIEIDMQSDLSAFFLTAAVVTDYFTNEDGSILMGVVTEFIDLLGRRDVASNQIVYAVQTPHSKDDPPQITILELNSFTIYPRNPMHLVYILPTHIVRSDPEQFAKGFGSLAKVVQNAIPPDQVLIQGKGQQFVLFVYFFDKVNPESSIYLNFSGYRGKTSKYKTTKRYARRGMWPVIVESLKINSIKRGSFFFANVRINKRCIASYNLNVF